MATELDKGRPNIRIEIKNNSEPMDVDENNRSEEEGEIRDNLSNIRHSDSHMSNNVDGKQTFQQERNIFNTLEQKKLIERAKRFSLKPEEINTFTERDLEYLYRSLGITASNLDQVRFEAIHVRTSKETTVRNVVTYFMEYAPNTIEKIDDESYNIVWEDKLSTARALFYISQMVRDMPVRVASEHIIDNFILDESESLIDGKVLNENRQIELIDDNFYESDKLVLDSSVDISVINVPIPPGYWRIGKKLINSYSVLMRFSLKIDKKPYQVEKCNKYFKNIPLNRNNESQYKGIFSRNKDIKEVHDKDPWGVLAKNWDKDLMFREREHFAYQKSDENMINPIAVESEMRVRLAAKRRLGQKQNQQLVVTPSSDKEQTDESEHEAERKSIKMPRMRMYADEEEEKIKRKKLLLTLKKQTEKLRKTEIANSDLRNILQITNKNPKANTSHDEVDLSVNLKNRGRKLVFTVSQDGLNSETQRFSLRDRLDKQPRAVSPEDKKPISPIRFRRNDSTEKKKWPIKEHHRERKRVGSPLQRRESRRSTDRFSGRMYSSKLNENYLIQKPKSKVALVIKTQKKPSVASTIQSRNRKFDSSSSSEESSSEDSSSASSEDASEDSSSTSEDSESDNSIHRRHHSHTKLNKVPLKVEIKNDQYKRK